MSWYGPDNGGRQAGGGNSGGPMCWHPRNQGFRIVSITRESKDNLTIGSWIGQERDCWLRSKIGVIDATQQTDRHWTAFRHLELEGPDSIGTARVEVPAWASDARVTMNGTENHLQLASGFGVSDDALRERVQSHRGAGQFLSRQPSIEGGAEGDARTLSLAATYVGRPRRAEWPIRLQISVLAR